MLSSEQRGAIMDVKYHKTALLLLLQIRYGSFFVESRKANKHQVTIIKQYGSDCT